MFCWSFLAIFAILIPREWRVFAVSPANSSPILDRGPGALFNFHELILAKDGISLTPISRADFGAPKWKPKCGKTKAGIAKKTRLFGKRNAIFFLKKMALKIRFILEPACSYVAGPRFFFRPEPNYRYLFSLLSRWRHAQVPFRW